MKIRVKFKKHGPVRFIGHLDVMRFFQKAIRRAELDIAYTSGYSPHQIMSFAAPLGVGLESNGEYMDIELNTVTSSEDMIERWNNNVPKDGIVFILGDIAFHMSKNKIKDILNQLNGKKYLIMGNHDRLDSLPLECFEHISMMDQIVIKSISIDGESEYTTCILSHYPLMRWAGVTRGVISLHGHEHGNIPNKEYMFNQMDVGWDTFGQPYSWKDICESFTYRLMTNDGQPNVGF